MTKATDPAVKAESKPDASPEALLKAVVTGARPPAPARRRLDPLLLAVGGGALALGLIGGAGLTAASLPRADGGASELRTGLEAARGETARVGAEVERLGRLLATVQDAAEAARRDGASRGAVLTERVAKAEQALTGKLAALGDRMEQAERETAKGLAALAGQVEKQRAAAATIAPVAIKAEPARVEPVTTGAIEAKRAPEKPAVVDGWAVRDVYEGMAILEDRRRRLVEVGPGGVVPGVGRVEAVERRGREWVVVTRQGLITPQSW